MSTQTLQVVNMFRRPRKMGTAVFKRPNEWLVLGHFDTLSIEQLPLLHDSPLRTIWGDIQAKRSIEEKDTAYFHPTYLVSEETDYFPGFLGEDRPFLFFTRIHSNAMEDVDIGSLQDELEAIFEKYPDVPHFYSKTLELSDLVLLSKSNSIERLLSVLEELSNSPAIGDIYSYCCVSQAALSENRDAQCIDSSDNIGLVSLRFAVRDSLAAARKQVKKWVDKRDHKCFFVTGTEDVNLFLNDVSSSELVLLLKDIIMDSSNGEIWEHFDDMTTRLGIPILDSLPDDSDRVNNPPPRISNSYQELYDQLMNHTELSAANWFQPLLQMLNTLTAVGENCVLNQLCYVLLDGLQGLMAKFRERSPISSLSGTQGFVEGMEKSSISSLSDTQGFVSGMVYLAEHMTRMESQLIHHPETRPLLFHIPASIMELDLAFVDLCADYLQIADSKKRHFYFSIIPALQSTVNIKNLVYQERDQAYLLYVGIPLDCCYDPGFIVRVLVHEIAHFSGETARFRETRKDGMIGCCAYMLCQLLEIGHYKKAGTRRLALKLKEIIEKREPSKEQPLLIMENLMPVLQEACRAVFLDQQFIYRLLTLAAQDDDGSGAPRIQRLEGYVQNYKCLLSVGGIQAVTDALMELETLYRECYADIAMIQLLDMDAETYFRLIQRSYDVLNQSSPKGALERKNWEGTKRFREAVVVQRAGLVAAASFSEDAGRMQSSAGSLGRKIALYLREFQRSGERDMRNVDHNMSSDSDKSCFLDFKVADEIYKYLCKCCEEMLEIGKQHYEAKRHIRDIYDTFAVREQYMSPTQVESISAFRKKLLRR